MSGLALHSWDVHRSQGRLVELPDEPGPRDATPTARLLVYPGRWVT